MPDADQSKPSLAMEATSVHSSIAAPDEAEAGDPDGFDGLTLAEEAFDSEKRNTLVRSVRVTARTTSHDEIVEAPVLSALA